MTFKKSLLAAIAVATTALTPLAASAQPEKIGLAVANLQANFFNQIKQSVEAYASEKGIEVITVDAKGDSATQVSQVQDLLTQGIDALIYIPAGAAAATVPVRLAHAQGIPVVNVDRNAEGEPGDTFIASDSVVSAYEICKYMFEQAGGSGDMVIVHGQKGTTPEVDRSKGCTQAMEEFPGIKVVAEQFSQIWSQDEGFQMTQNMLQAHPDVTLVWGQADALALGAAQAVKVANLPQRIWVFGFDGDTAALEALRDGVFDATSTQRTQYFGQLAVDSAIKLVNGEEVPAEQLLPATLTTKENVEPFIANHP
ncbi:sugar ABC transporter substrate-binding protein [Tropicimonas sp. IMCC34043]|uniref:sugar ABC transporter substrate-binding protein n=1 Tax=Tropicimonas sp. IMCC34043 TaxID=2248760 RepID=UPI000E238755|nr:sugar ABC transporter substrate-binding protein [Tropicimonas sp. IMCC34043]